MEEERCITRDKIKFQEENVCPVKKNGKTPRLVPDLLFLLFPAALVYFYSTPDSAPEFPEFSL